MAEEQQLSPLSLHNCHCARSLSSFSTHAMIAIAEAIRMAATERRSLSGKNGHPQMCQPWGIRLVLTSLYVQEEKS